jgi:hypothetical protein
LTANHTSCAHPSLKQCSIKESDTNGSHANGSHANGEKATHRSVQGIVGTSSHPHILTWSASDESGIQRLAQVWKPYFRGVSLNPDESEQYLHNLAHTLNRRRSRLPWMTYALMDANTKLEAVVDSWKPPTRCQESRNMAYVFSGVSNLRKPKTGENFDNSYSKGPNGLRWAASCWLAIRPTATASSRQATTYRELAVNGTCLVSYPQGQ